MLEDREGESVLRDPLPRGGDGRAPLLGGGPGGGLPERVVDAPGQLAVHPACLVFGRPLQPHEVADLPGGAELRVVDAEPLREFLVRLALGDVTRPQQGGGPLPAGSLSAGDVVQGREDGSVQEPAPCQRGPVGDGFGEQVVGCEGEQGPLVLRRGLACGRDPARRLEHGDGPASPLLLPRGRRLFGVGRVFRSRGRFSWTHAVAFPAPVPPLPLPPASRPGHERADRQP